MDGECSDLIWQKRKELDPNLEKRRPRVSRTARALKPTEAAEFRLAPTDGLLEKQVLFAVCALWVPVLPDSPAPGEEGGVSWRRWLFDYCHCTFINPHRAAGETYQILRRSGYWEQLVPDFHKWYSACEVCQKHRARPVAPPMRSIQGDDQARARLPW